MTSHGGSDHCMRLIPSICGGTVALLIQTWELDVVALKYLGGGALIGTRARAWCAGKYLGEGSCYRWLFGHVEDDGWCHCDAVMVNTWALYVLRKLLKIFLQSSPPVPPLQTRRSALSRVHLQCLYRPISLKDARVIRREGLTIHHTLKSNGH